ncbi:MAG: flagellar motor switch protein FliG [Silicimonas sp.]|nr:flagellar motor switch protein FliG [Silicimonas sp.]
MNDFPVSLPPLDRPAPALSSKEKAAIVVRLLLAHGALPALSSLPESKQTELALQLARMAPVAQETVTSVANEFADEIERIGISFPTGLDGALGLLDGMISEGATSRLKQMAPGNFRRNPWEEIENAELDRLVGLLENESIEVAAVVLSKLNVTRAAEVLGKLPGEKSRRITYAISTTSAVSPAVVLRIGMSLAEQLDARPVTAFSEGPVKRVGAILNYAPSGLRDDVLTGLEDEDKAFADDVRAAIFTFANIAERIAPRDVPRVQRDLDQDDLTLIVAGAEGGDKASADFILANISKRMAENIRDDAKELANVAADDVEAAMIRVVGTIRELEAQGDIFFVANEG